MATTIQVESLTKQKLKLLKGDDRKSYDQIINELADAEFQRRGHPDSLFGAYPNLKWNKES